MKTLYDRLFLLRNNVIRIKYFVNICEHLLIAVYKIFALKTVILFGRICATPYTYWIKYVLTFSEHKHLKMCLSDFIQIYKHIVLSRRTIRTTGKS